MCGRGASSPESRGSVDRSQRLDEFSPHYGSDGCGTVESVGDGVDEAWLGKRIVFNAALPAADPTGPDARPSRPPEIGLIGSDTLGSMDEFREVTALFRAGKLKPVIDKVFPSSRAAEAYRRLQASEQFGKVVIRWS